MNYLPSKELLSTVLGLHCGIKSIKNSEVIYWFDCIGEIREHSINIYELAHKCKEWAFSNMLLLSSGYDIQGGWCIDRVSNTSFVSEDEPYTEPEAIFKACEWILDNRN